MTTAREGEPRGELLRWGLVPLLGQGSEDVGLKMINARAETVAEKPRVSRRFAAGAASIVADGFYEWEKRRASRKQPWHITRRRRRAVRVRRPVGEVAPGRRASSRCARSRSSRPGRRAAGRDLHDRMPVILPRDGGGAWLDPRHRPEALHGACCVPLPEQTAARAVGDAVNDARHDEPDCLERRRAAMPRRHACSERRAGLDAATGSGTGQDADPWSITTGAGLGPGSVACAIVSTTACESRAPATA